MSDMDSLVILLKADFGSEIYLWLGIAASVVAVLGGIAALPGWIKSVRGVFRKVKRVFDLIDYELQKNGGGSIKDHSEKAMIYASKALEVSTETDSKVDATNAKVDSLAAQFHSFVETHSLEHKSLNQAIKGPSAA